MKRYAFFIYGVACHLLFLATYAWMAAFTGNLFLPKSIDAEGATFSWSAVGVNLVLLIAFGLQHSIMARPTFKKAWTRIVPEPIERSTYVLASCILFAAVMLLWQPMGPIVWDASGTVMAPVMWTLFAAGWLMVPLVSLLINHFDLFGTRQVWLNLKGKTYGHTEFKTPGIYSRIRHPLYVGWMIAFWATPVMSAGHLLYASILSAYMIIAIYFEERNLVEVYGDQYRAYQRDVPALIPALRKKHGDTLQPEAQM